MSDKPPDFSQAVALFKSFQLREPRYGEIVQLGGLPQPVTALAVGTAISIGYKALRDGKDYYHEFESSRPRVFVSADGRQVFFEGGSYRFSPRGFLR